MKNQVVEFECDPKYLKGLIVDKGLWRVNSDPNFKVLINLKETKYGFSKYSLFCFLYFPRVDLLSLKHERINLHNSEPFQL